MKKHILSYTAIGVSLLMAMACRPSLDEFTPSAGNANFTKYIAVGNSLTAGYADGGLYNEGINYSYTKLISQQLSSVGGGSFVVPSFDSGQENGSGYVKLDSIVVTTKNGISSTKPYINPITTSSAIVGKVSDPFGFGVSVTVMTPYDVSQKGLNNFGVPGIKLVTAFPYTPLGNATQTASATYYGDLNGYYLRLLGGTNADGTHTTPYLNFVLDKGNKNKSGDAEPYTFFSCWLGNNDALGYATGGGADPTALTDATLFGLMYDAAIKSLTNNGTTKGVVATIPDVTSIPYFSAVTAASLSAGVQVAMNTTATIDIYVYDTSTGGGRKATSSDLIILEFPTSKLGSLTEALGAGLYPYGMHPSNPIENKYVLDPTEQATVKGAVASYNTTIKSVASKYGVALWDANSYMATLKATGVVENGVGISANFISGGAFSLDGVHPTPRGAALMANQFIKAINSYYGANVPLLNVASYRGVKMP